MYRRRDAHERFVSSADIRRPVLTVATPLAEVEGGDCPLCQKSGERDDERNCQLQNAAPDRRNTVEQIQGEWRAQDVER